MSFRTITAALAAATLLLLAYPLPGFAQATRTWVSGVGDDANPCSRTAPCKTFAGAISKTAAGGEMRSHSREKCGLQSPSTLFAVTVGVLRCQVRARKIKLLGLILHSV